MPPRIVEDLPEDQKRCCTCKKVKHIDDYHKSSSPRDTKGRKPRCKECANSKANKAYHALPKEKKQSRHKQSAAWYSANATAILLKRLAKKYGITVERIKQMLADQKGLCALCGKAPAIRTEATLDGLTIDHDHQCCSGDKSCGKCVRELLCHSCNVGLGHFGDDPALLREAADYIERHRKIGG